MTPSTSSPAVPTSTSRAPRVLAIVVATTGGEWLTAALRTLAAQGYPRLEVVGVDNGATDNCGEVLTRRLGEDFVVSLDANAGFARAVAAGLDLDTGQRPDYVLLVHDDMALMPDAVQWLVDAMESEDDLGIVGPKLRDWNEEGLLQSVGMSADVFGRAERQIDDGEVDQGQHDARQETLYVPSSGMLIRAEVLATLGGFDSRFMVFRDDMDLCWRVWNSGRRVAVVPEAVAYHVAAATGGLRPELDRARVRYLVERNTLAAIIKNYATPRLLWILPLGAVLSVARVLALLVSRRFGEAFAIVRAYIWNVAQLGGTLRRRRAVQSSRRRSDREVGAHFVTGLPRLQQYSYAFLELVAGTNNRALVDAEDIGRVGIDPLSEQPIKRFFRDRPLLLIGAPLLVAFLISLVGLLGSGQVVGGEIRPWPEAASAFMTNYLSAWGGEPLASASFPSPVQAVLGLLGTLVGGGAWLAQRVSVFGLVPLAFVTTLRAGRLVTHRPWPRVIGAAVYVLSPVVLGTLSQGRYGLLMIAALLPAAVSLTITTASPSTSPAVAWRSAALLSLTVLLTLGSAPVEGLMVVAIVVVAALVALLRGWVRPLLRLTVGITSAILLLGPWLFDLVRDGGPGAGTLDMMSGQHTDAPLSAWRALTGMPAQLDGLDGIVGIGMLCIPAAVLLGVLVVGMRSRPLISGALLLGVVAFAAAAWVSSRLDLALVTPTALLLPATVCIAALAMIAARWSAEFLAGSDFGVGQIGAAVAGFVGAIGLLAGLLLLTAGPWQGLTQSPVLVPAFIGAQGDQIGQYRVLLLDRTEQGGVVWEITDNNGPDMVSFGTIRDRALTGLIGETVTQISGGVGSGAAATLGVLNVRYVVLRSPDMALQTSLSQQVDLDPLSSEAAVTYQVRTWLPRAGLLSEPQASRLLSTGDPGPTDPLDVTLSETRPGVYVSNDPVPASGLLVLSESGTSAWRAAGDGGELQQVEVQAINAFSVDEPDVDLRVVAGGASRRRIVVALQVLIALAVISLAVRPPGQRAERRRVTALPADLVGLADTTTSFKRIDVELGPDQRGGDGR